MAEIVELEICYICDDSFQDLEEHFYDKHTSWKIYKCDICNKDYNSDKELLKHRTDFHAQSSDIKEKITDHQNQKFSLEDQTCKVISRNNKKVIQVILAAETSQSSRVSTRASLKNLDMYKC